MTLERSFTEQWRELTELQTHWRVITRAITIALHDFGQLDAFVEQLAALIHEELRYDHFGIGLVDADSRMVYRGGYGLPEEGKNRFALAPGEGIVGWVFQHGQALLVRDVREDPRYFKARGNTRSELCVPFFLHGQVLGVINAESDRPGAFSARDVELLTALTGVLALLLQDLMRREGAAPIMQELTEQEQVVLRLLAHGQDDRHIARELHISLNTVRTHLRAIFQKLQVNSRAQAIVWVHKHGLFCGDEP